MGYSLITKTGRSDAPRSTIKKVRLCLAAAAATAGSSAGAVGGFEGSPAAASGNCIGIVDFEATAHDAVFVINRGIGEIHHAGGINKYFHAISFDDVIVRASFGFQGHAIL